MAWNISLFPKEEQANAQEILLRPLLKQIKGDEVSVILKQIKIFIERKNRYYPCIREFIHKHTLSFSGDMVTLTVKTEKLPEEIKRRVPLETSPKGDV